MNEQLELLVKLQKIDSSILSLADDIKSLPDRLNKYKVPLKEIKDAYDKAKSKQDALNKKKKSLDMKLDEIQDKIEKLKSRSSSIKTNKEYDAHLKEIENHEKRIYQIEDEILSIMEEIETYKVDFKGEDEKVKKAEAEFAEHERLVAEDQKKLIAEIEAQKARRKEYTERLDPREYKHYMTLLERSGGLAVVETKDEICLGCNTNIPPQLFNDIKKNDKIYFCYFCKRFLYFAEPVVTESPADGSQPTS